MHMVTAIIKPHRLEDVTEALKENGVAGVTVSEVQGFGRQRGHNEVYRGSEYHVDYVPKTRVEVVCDDADAEKIAAGKVWITEVARVMRIRTGEIGADAL